MSVENAVTGQTIQATVTQGAAVGATMGNSASVSGQPGMPVIRYVKDSDLYPAIDGYMDGHPEIPAPTTASVGQTIRVTAVDEGGKPTAWEAVDFPESMNDSDAIEVLAECGIITPAYQDGVFYTDTSGAIYVL